MNDVSNQKAIIFVDGGNFYHKLKHLASSQKGKVKLMDLDYQAFARHITQSADVVDIRYYIGAIKRQKSGPTKEHSEKLYASQQKFMFALRRQNVSIILGDLIQHPDKSFHEKGVDVRIAVEMIRLALKGEYDTAYLISSDTDLVPAVEEVRTIGKKVVYVGTSLGQSFGLTKAASDTILLRDSDVLPFVVASEDKLKKKRPHKDETLQGTSSVGDKSMIQDTSDKSSAI